MKNKAVLLIVVQLMVANVLLGQSLKESLGGIKTNFQIFSDTVDLKNSNQIIILKAEKKHDQYADSYSGYGWGYGYQSFHLEFITNKDLTVKTYKRDRGTINREDKLDLKFYDAENNVIASTIVPFEYVDLLRDTQKEGGPYFYSIDLIDIPVVLLDKTSKIDMVKLVASN
jgi:hypothetical protein